MIEAVIDFFDKNGADVDERISWHHANGWVIHTPYCFGMGYFFQEGETIVLHVTFVTGNMAGLFQLAPKNVIDIIEFERNCNGKPKRYNYEKFRKRIEHG